MSEQKKDFLASYQDLAKWGQIKKIVALVLTNNNLDNFLEIMVKIKTRLPSIDIPKLDTIINDVIQEHQELDTSILKPKR